MFSGLDHTAFDLAVYASQGKSPDPTQDSLLAAGPAFPGGIGYPQGSNERFPSSRLFLPSRAFLAQEDRDWPVATQPKIRRHLWDRPALPEDHVGENIADVANSHTRPT